MRKLKFRVWNTLNKKFESQLNSKLFVQLFGDIVEHTDNEFFEVNHKYELNQFIGLTEKNGIEVYEGDILYCELHDRKMQVVWHEECVTFAGKIIGESEDYDFFQKYDFQKLCVIGNIYENADILSF